MKIEALRKLIRELIKTELQETNSLGASGAGTSIQTGQSDAYATPNAFLSKSDWKKKKKKIKYAESK